MRALLLAGTAVIVLGAGSAVLAQNDTGRTNHANLRSNLTQMLQKSGYTDIRVAPSSFVVRAKDQNGNPVVMSISPDEFTEVTAMANSGNNNGTTGNASNSNGSNSTNAGNANGGNAYVNVPDQDDLSSKVVGLDVYNNDNKDIGTIKDIALNPNGRTNAYILSVGGFLGVGDRYVAVSPSAVKVTYNDSDKKWHATMNATADQLKAAPEFKYTGKWNSNRT
jgi:sporulation protein YlmC with PRC-barrel domain